MVPVALDVTRVRAAFPALDHGIAHFDGPGGSQAPRRWPMRSPARWPPASRTAGPSRPPSTGPTTPSARRARAIADLLGADARGVVFGRSMTQLTYDMSRALAKDWAAGDEVVVTRLDHDGNIRPWVQAAAAAGATVRWADFDPYVGRAGARAGHRVARRTVPGWSPSPARPTCSAPAPTSPAIAAAAHAVGALVYVDGVHLTPHAPVDVAGARRRLLRLLAVQVLRAAPRRARGRPGAARDASSPDKLLPSSDAVPERFELGTLPYELLAGVVATVDFLAGLDGGAGDGGAPPEPGAWPRWPPSRSTRTGSSTGWPTGLRALDRVTLHSDPRRHTPTLLFSVDGQGAAGGLREARRLSASTRRPGTSTRWRRRGGSASATPVRSGPGWRPTPMTRTSTACSPASPRSARERTGRRDVTLMHAAFGSASAPGR